MKQTTYSDNTRAVSAKSTGSKWRTVALHIICWAIFLYVPATYNPHFENPRIIDILGEILEPFRIANSIYFIILFYINYLFAIPALYFTRRYPAFIAYCITSLVVLALVNTIIRPGFMEPHHHEEHHHHHEHHFNGFRLFGPSFNFYIFITIWCISFTMCVYTKWRSMYEEKLNTEIAFLKAQINPHFLFNTLNSIYSLSLSGSEEAPEAILKLSGMMRYAVSETTHQYVALEKEIEYIADYIELQKLRLTPDIKMDYNFTGDWTGKQIAPFLLIPFIENAFKYGVNAAESSAINIDIAVTGNELELRVDNKKVNIMHVDKGTGLGIGNTRKRLQLVYPGKHNLTIVDGEKDFKVTLKISLV